MLAFFLASFVQESASSYKTLISLARRFFFFSTSAFFLKNCLSLPVLRCLMLLFLLRFKIGKVTVSLCTSYSSCCKKIPANCHLTKHSNTLNVVMNCMLCNECLFFQVLKNLSQQLLVTMRKNQELVLSLIIKSMHLIN